jgi:hypothetical protein
VSYQIPEKSQSELRPRDAPLSCNVIVDHVSEIDDLTTLGHMLEDVDHEFWSAEGGGLTMVEGMGDLCWRHYHLRNVYFGAVRRSLCNRLTALESGLHELGLPRALSRWCASSSRSHSAKRRLDLLNAAGPLFYSTREHCEASADCEYRESVAEMYWQRLKELRRIRDTMANARKVGRRVTRTISSPTGFVKTGRFLWKDGVKIPVVRKQL